VIKVTEAPKGFEETLVRQALKVLKVFKVL